MLSSGIFATPALRNSAGAVSGAAAHTPAFGGAPSGFEIAALRASGALPVGWPRRGRLRRSEGPSRASEGRLRAWEGPRRSGGLRVSLRSPPGCPPGLRCSSRRVLRRSRVRCPLGFPFSLSPLLYLHSIDRHPPVSSPGGVSFATFPSTIRHRSLLTRTLRHGNLPRSNLPQRRGKLHLRSRNLPRGRLLGGNLHLRSSNLRLRR